MFRFVCRAGVVGLVWASAACTEPVRLGRELGPVGGGASGGGATASAGTSGSGFPLGGATGSGDAGPLRPPPADAGPCTPLPCGGGARACGNCDDDDGDG